MPSPIKTLMVAELTRRFRDLSHAVLVDFTGVSAGQANGLRGTLEEHGARMFVVRNSLACQALRQLDLADVAGLVTGPTAFIAGGDDPVALAKAIIEWGRKEDVLSVRGGLLDGKAVGPEQVRAMSALPPLIVLRAQAAGAIAAPLTSFVGALQGIIRSFVGVIKAIAEKDEG